MAQVVGAGYSVSQETGDTATIVKLLRVAMLLPVCLAIGLALHVRGAARPRTRRRSCRGSRSRSPRFVVVNSLGWIPRGGGRRGGELSRWCLVTAIAAIGMKTSLKSLVDMGLQAR